MSVTSTITGKLILSKPYRIIITPLSGDGDTKGTSYALDNIVKDSTKISQDDNDVSEIECETRDENIWDVVSLGKYNFECSNADWREDFLVALLGWTKDATSGRLSAPTSYKEVFAEIEVQWDDPAAYGETGGKSDGNYRGSIVLPKVLLSGKATLENMKSGVGQMTVAGKAYSGYEYNVTYTAGSDGNPSTFTATKSSTMSPIYYSPKPINV